VVYPVNSKREAVQGLQAYKDIPSLPQPPDLAVICTPAPTVPAIVRACGETGTRVVMRMSLLSLVLGQRGRHFGAALTVFGFGLLQGRGGRGGGLDGALHRPLLLRPKREEPAEDGYQEDRDEDSRVHAPILPD